jgi:hypothetical protein
VSVNVFFTENKIKLCVTKNLRSGNILLMCRQGQSQDFDPCRGVDLKIWKYPMYILFSYFNRWSNLIVY